MAYLAGIGGANLDIHGRSLAPIIMRDSNPGVLHTSPGGVLRNILENTARLGLPTKIASVVGDDTNGRVITDACRAAGMDTTYLKVLPGQRSSSYISVMDDTGDMLIAMSDMHIIKQLDGRFVTECLPLLNAAELVVCDGNLSGSAFETLRDKCTRPLYLDPVSTHWAHDLLPYLPCFDTIKPNRLEMEVLADMPIPDDAALNEAADKVLALGVRRLFISLGADGMFYKDRSGLSLRQSAKGFHHLVNATGAGDASMAGIVYGTWHDLSPAETLDCAVGASLIALTGNDTINPGMNPETLKTMIKEYLT